MNGHVCHSEKIGFVSRVVSCECLFWSDFVTDVVYCPRLRMHDNGNPGGNVLPVVEWVHWVIEGVGRRRVCRGRRAGRAGRRRRMVCRDSLARAGRAGRRRCLVSWNSLVKVLVIKTLSEKDLVEVLVSGAARHINCATAIALTHAQGDHSTYQSLLDEPRD